jgi:hypothetical protein
MSNTEKAAIAGRSLFTGPLRLKTNRLPSIDEQFLPTLRALSHAGLEADQFFLAPGRGAGGRTPTRSTARRWFVRRWTTSEASRACARWSRRRHPRRRTAAVSAASVWYKRTGCAPGSNRLKDIERQPAGSLARTPMRTVCIGMAAVSRRSTQRRNDDDPRTKNLPLRDLHPQIDRAESRSHLQLARCPARGLRGLYQEPGA